MNVRANWELILIQWLQVFIVSVVLLAGAVPPLAVLGWTELASVEPSQPDLTSLLQGLAGLVSRGREAWLLLLASFLLASAIWFMGMLIYCYFQGGIFGVLAAAERQAPVGKPRSWRWFRTFNTSDLRGWAGRYLWRYFWLLNLFLLISLAWLLIPLVLALLAVWAEARWGQAAALGIGCGGAIPVAFSIFVLAFWISLAQADLAREESEVWVATRRGLGVLGRRLGTILLLGVVGFAIALTLGVIVAVISLAINISLAGWASAQLSGQLILTFLEWLASSALGVAFAAILIALMHSEPLPEVMS